VASPGNAPDSLIEAVGHLERALVELGEESTGYWPHDQPQYSDRMAGGSGVQCEASFLATRCELSDGHDGLHAVVTDQYIALAWQVPHWAG